MGKIIELETQTYVKNKIDLIFSLFTGKQHIKIPFFLTGPSGSGKSYLVENLCKKYRMKCHRISAAGLTNEGQSGASISRVLEPLKQENLGVPFVVFFDEFDKPFTNDNPQTTRGIQNELLTILDGGPATIIGNFGKYEQLDLSNGLFIFSGCFQGIHMNEGKLKEFGITDEFLGRVNQIFSIPEPTDKELELILRNDERIEAFLKDEHYATYDKYDVVNDILAHIKTHYTPNLGLRLTPKFVNSYFLNYGNFEAVQN